MCVFDSNIENSVLVVDDEEWNVSALIDNLNEHQVYVEYVSDPEAALELLAEGQEFSAIISDLNMDSMNGYQFLHFLRGNYEPLVEMGGLKALRQSDYSIPSEIIKSRKAYERFVFGNEGTNLVLFCGQSYKGMNLKLPEGVHVFQKEMGVEGRVLDHLYDVGVIQFKREDKGLYIPQNREELDFLDSICEEMDLDDLI